MTRIPPLLPRHHHPRGRRGAHFHRVLADAKASQYKDYGWLRGFSVVPSWGARIEEAWWLYDGARFREEVGLARQVHANCIRLWIEFTAWMADPDKITAHFLDAVAAIDEAGMKTMPCLFNRWHDGRYDYGGTYLDNHPQGLEAASGLCARAGHAAGEG